MHTFHEGHKDYKCEYCSNLFQTSQSLKKHVTNIHIYPRGHTKRIHEQLEKRQKCKQNQDNLCETCGKVFFNAKLLKSHIYVVHEGHKDFLCELCQKFFGFKQLLERHMKIKHNIEVTKQITENSSGEISDQIQDAEKSMEDSVYDDDSNVSVKIKNSLEETPDQNIIPEESLNQVSVI